MKIKNVCFIAVVMAMVTMLIPATQLWAGFEGGDPPDPGKIQGPELWAVAVIYCSNDFSMGGLRVKRVKDCNVQVQTYFDSTAIVAAGCPANANAYIYTRFAPGTFFPADTDIPPTGTPIITKIKNFDAVVEGTETNEIKKISFDAQIKFEMP